MSARILGALAVADFRERTRRPAYLVTLAAAIVLGYLALPPASSLYVIMNAGGYRGIYNTAYAGTATALAGGLWLMLAGFYVVRGTIDRDQRTGVGQILAATPLRNTGYLAGKFLSNLLVLASMAGVLAVTALAIQLARGESRAIGLGALLLPFALFTLPVLTVTAAAAVLFDALPVLRGGLGNIAWFFVWMICVIAGSGAPLGGMGTVTASMRTAMAAQHLPPAGQFSVGFTKVGLPLRTFTWHGLEPSGGLITSRIVLIMVAAVLAAVPAIWFGRFDPARNRPRRGGGPAPGGEILGAPAPATGQAARPTPPPAYKALATGRDAASPGRRAPAGRRSTHPGARNTALVVAGRRRDQRRRPRRPRRHRQAGRRQHRSAAGRGLDLARPDLVPAGHPAPRERARHPARRLPRRLPPGGSRMGSRAPAHGA